MSGGGLPRTPRAAPVQSCLPDSPGPRGTPGLARPSNAPFLLGEAGKCSRTIIQGPTDGHNMEPMQHEGAHQGSSPPAGSVPPSHPC